MQGTDRCCPFCGAKKLRILQTLHVVEPASLEQFRALHEGPSVGLTMECECGAEFTVFLLDKDLQEASADI